MRLRLQSVKLPKVLADLQFANQFLKIFSLLTLGLSLISIALALGFVYRGPLVIALSPNAERLTLQDRPIPEKEVEAALRQYISLRYGWDSKNVAERLSLSKAFVSSSALRSFDSSLAEVSKFAIDRSVSQKAYVSEITVDLSQKRAKIRGDRVSTIQGLTAAGPLSLILDFDYGTRTRENPWGIFVSKERNE